METAHGNFYKDPHQPVRPGITRCIPAGHVTMDKGCTLSLAKCDNGNAKRPHTHPHAQLAIVLEGSCDYYVDGTPYKMESGSWVYVPENVEHYIDVHDSTDANGNPAPCMNLDVFFPTRPEYVAEYDEFLKSLGVEK